MRNRIDTIGRTPTEPPDVGFPAYDADANIRRAVHYAFVLSVWCFGTNRSGQRGERNYTLTVQ